jgi:hypothetical protein
VRVAEVEADGGERLVTLEVHERVDAVVAGVGRVGEAPRTEVDRDEAVRLETHVLGAGAGRDGELGRRLETLAAQVGGEDPRAVAAHLGGAPVGVAVVHEPGGLRRLGPHRLLGCQGGRHDPDHAVAADPGASVGEQRDLAGHEVVGAVEVGHEDEVVLGAVPLGEGQCVSHAGHCP